MHHLIRYSPSCKAIPYLLFRILLILIMIFASATGYSQDSTGFVLGTTQFRISFQFPCDDQYLLNHSPEKKDSALVEENATLIGKEPALKNHITFFDLACSLWELRRLTEAEKMFLKIVESEKRYYTQTTYHSSGTKYGYGSYTINYKSDACRYLAKIYIKQGKFSDAIQYLEWADKKYEIIYTCGTGYRWYRDQIDGLYGFCYNGLGHYDSTINMFLPSWSERCSETLVQALKAKYTPSETSNYLDIAENSIRCVLDTFQSSYTTIENAGTPKEKVVQVKYTSGTGTIRLFGKDLTLLCRGLQEGEVVSREYFVRQFRESVFYNALEDHE